MVSERDGGIGRPGWVATGMLQWSGFGVPEAQVFKDDADERTLIDDGDDAHRGAASRACQGVDLIGFLNKPGPVGFG